MQPLNPVCTRFDSALKAAMAAVYHLSDHGCVPLRIELGDRRPVIQIEPPRDSTWLRGALKSRITINNTTRTVMAAPYHGCQLEWQVVDYRAPEALQA